MKAKKIFVIISFMLILAGFQRNGYAQDEVIRIDSNLVTVPATVFDRDGRYVTNLKKEDFQVFEDGIEQEIAFFESIEKPFTVILMLDVSGSMMGSVDILANAASVFLHKLRPNDQIAAVTFNESVDVLFNFTSAKEVWNRKKFKLRVDGGPPITMVYDATEFALKKMKKIHGRKAIILFSDAIGSGYFASAKSNLKDAEEHEAIIYTVQFGAFERPLPGVNEKKFYEAIDTASWYMRELAARTGGQHYQMENIGNLEKTFGEIADELGRQYSLGYYPKETETGQKRQVRKIKVKVRQPNLVVRARESYVVEESKNKKR